MASLFSIARAGVNGLGTFISGPAAREVGDSPDLSRRLAMTGVVAAVAVGVVCVSLPSKALADHSRRRSRRDHHDDFEDHSRWRSERDRHDRDRSQRNRHSRHRSGNGWDRDDCFMVGPLMVCP